MSMIKAIKAVLATFGMALGLAASEAGNQAVAPSTFDHELVVDATSAPGGDGSATKPFATLAAGINAATVALNNGQSVRVRIKSGIYREGDLHLAGAEDVTKNSGFVDAWLALEAEDGAVLTGADDWSWRDGGATDWQPVAGQPGVFSRPWTANWGPWGGWRGSSNIATLTGQRREMVYVQATAGSPWQRLTTVALEDFSYSSIADDGTTATWFGAGAWTYNGIRTPQVLTPGCAGVYELGPDDTATNDPTQQYQPGQIYTVHAKPESRVSFSALYAKHPHPLHDRMVIRLPEGVDIRQARIEVSTRAQGLRIANKRHVVVRGLTLQRYAGRAFANQPAFFAGSPYFEWYLNHEDWQLERLTLRDNNDVGMIVFGFRNSTVKECHAIDNGCTGIFGGYLTGVRFTGLDISGTGWRSKLLGGPSGGGFIPAGLKTWTIRNCLIDQCRFVNNHEKGFYSDSLNVDTRFDRCEFRGNGMGVMFEIPHGPLTLEDCAFTANRQGIELVSAAHVTFRRCTFTDNSLAALTIDPRSRTSEGTWAFSEAATPFGYQGFGLKNTLKTPQNSNHLVVAACTFAAPAWPGARLVRETSTWSNREEWISFLGTSTWQNNRWRHAANTLPCGGDNRHVDPAAFEAYVATLGGTVTPGTVVITAPDLPIQVYPSGHTWSRRADWDAARTRSAELILFPEQWNGGGLGWDASGTPVWLVGATAGLPVGRGLGTTAPWYADLLDPLLFPPMHTESIERLIAKPGKGSGPIGSGWATRDTLLADAWPDFTSGEPVVAWRNPTGRAIRLAVSGELKLAWTKTGDSSPVEWAVAVISPGASPVLVASGIATPSTPGVANVTLNLPTVSVPIHGWLRYGVHYPGPSGWEHGVKWQDPVTLTLE